jgi:hypothetical protein
MNPVCKIHKIVLIFLLTLQFNAMASTAPKILDCPDFIDTSLIEFTKINCDTDAKICLNITLGNFLNYTLTDNGQPYSGGASVCDFDTSFAYTYFMLPGNGMSGPYMVDSWIVNGNTFSGQVADMAALADSMNAWDPLGNWVLDGPSSSIRGGSTALNYGSIVVTQISSGISTTLNLTLSLNPQGTLITLEIGYHELIFTEPVEGCQDTLIIDVDCTPCPDMYTGNLETSWLKAAIPTLRFVLICRLPNYRITRLPAMALHIWDLSRNAATMPRFFTIIRPSLRKGLPGRTSCKTGWSMALHSTEILIISQNS